VSITERALLLTPSSATIMALAVMAAKEQQAWENEHVSL
jgi:hypothetical protein